MVAAARCLFHRGGNEARAIMSQSRAARPTLKLLNTAAVPSPPEKPVILLFAEVKTLGNAVYRANHHALYRA
ncbi:hypothetical protein MSIMFB_04429 [Mycobacterium simulans]|uniref:Uncharacterized protein n=1 Tax=Mycobacterium simulans TaxID=627089 RepID=A0A7Z7INM4_9MYCO|nr:hypothetical protein MSIMFB_04429 [Mycobacterium simulans]